MTIKEIIDGLKFTMEMCLYNPTDGSMRPVSTLNDMDKTTYDACEGAIKLLEQQRWIPVSEPPKKNGEYLVTVIDEDSNGNKIYTKEKLYWTGMHWIYNFLIVDNVIAYMPLPQSYKAESEDKG